MKKVLFLATAIALVLTSCAKDETSGGNETAVLKIGNVGMLEALTRASAGYTNFTDDFSLNLAAVANAYEAINGKVFNYSSGSWSAASGEITLSATSTTVTAWAPTSISPSLVPNTFTLNSGIYSAANDLVYAKNIIVSKTASTITTLQLEHAHAMITVKYSAGSTYPGQSNFTSLSIDGLTGASTIDITDGTVVPGSAAGSIDLSSKLESSKVPTAGIALLAVPATSASVQLSCTIDGNNYGPLNVTGITALEQGRNYIVTLTTAGETLVIQNVEVADWADVDAGTVPVE